MKDGDDNNNDNKSTSSSSGEDDSRATAATAPPKKKCAYNGKRGTTRLPPEKQAESGREWKWTDEQIMDGMYDLVDDEGNDYGAELMRPYDPTDEEFEAWPAERREAHFLTVRQRRNKLIKEIQERRKNGGVATQTKRRKNGNGKGVQPRTEEQKERYAKKRIEKREAKKQEAKEKASFATLEPIGAQHQQQQQGLSASLSSFSMLSSGPAPARAPVKRSKAAAKSAAAASLATLEPVAAPQRQQQASGSRKRKAAPLDSSHGSNGEQQEGKRASASGLSRRVKNVNGQGRQPRTEYQQELYPKTQIERREKKKQGGKGGRLARDIRLRLQQLLCLLFFL